MKPFLDRPRLRPDRIDEMGMCLFWDALAVFEDVCRSSAFDLEEEGSVNDVASDIVSKHGGGAWTKKNTA